MSQQSISSSPIQNNTQSSKNQNNKRNRHESSSSDVVDVEMLRKKRIRLEEMKSQLEDYLERLQAALNAERDRMKGSIPADLSASTNAIAPATTTVPPSMSTTKRSVAISGGSIAGAPARRPSSAVVSKSKVGRSSTKKDDFALSGIGTSSSSSSIIPIDSILPEDTKTQLFKSCIRVLEDLAKHPKYDIFAAPVDWVALKIPDYPKVIKLPMDLGTVREKLTAGKYNTIYEFQSDVMLVWNNAKTFNPSGHFVHTWACQIQDLFEKKFKHVEREMKRIEKKAVESASAQPQKSKLDSSRKAKKPSGSKGKPLSFAEKQKLGENLRKVPPDQLIHIAEIINCKPRSSENGGPQELEIEMDQLDNATLRRLQEFVKSVVHPAKAKHKRPTASTATVSAVAAVPVGSQSDVIHDSDDSGNDTNSSSSFDSDLSSDDESSAKPSSSASGKAPAVSSYSGANPQKDVSIENSAAWSALDNSSGSKEGSELWKDLKSGAGDNHEEHSNGGVLQEQQIREMDEERQRQMQQLAASSNAVDEMEEVEHYANWANS